MIVYLHAQLKGIYHHHGNTSLLVSLRVLPEKCDWREMRHPNCEPQAEWKGERGCGASICPSVLPDSEGGVSSCLILLPGACPARWIVSPQTVSQTKAFFPSVAFVRYFSHRNEELIDNFYDDQMCSISSLITLHPYILGFLKPLLPQPCFSYSPQTLHRDAKLKNMLIWADCCSVIVH